MKKAADNSRREKKSIECLKNPPKSKLHRFFQLANSKYLWTEHFLSGRKERCVCASGDDSHWACIDPLGLCFISLDLCHHPRQSTSVQHLRGELSFIRPPRWRRLPFSGSPDPYFHFLLQLWLMESLQIGHIYSSEQNLYHHNRILIPLHCWWHRCYVKEPVNRWKLPPVHNLTILKLC